MRCVLSIDIDCFYAQAEELRRPELKGRPVGVQQKMLVITSNYAARAYGIQKGDNLAVVKRKCPDIIICNGEDLTFYTDISQQVFDFVAAWCGPECAVERLGLDEVFVDVTARVSKFLRQLSSSSEQEVFSHGVIFPETVVQRRSSLKPGKITTALPYVTIFNNLL